MHPKSIYEQRKRDRNRLLKIKELQEKQNKILDQIRNQRSLEEIRQKRNYKY